MRRLMLALVLSLVGSQDISEAEIRTIIGKLGSDKIEERESAATHLKKIGKKAVPVLENSLAGQDIETSVRIRRIIAAIQINESLPSILKATFPGLDDKLATNDSHEWLVALLEATSRNENGLPKHPQLSSTALGYLAAKAVQGAGTLEEKQTAIERVTTWNLTTAIPQLLQLVQGDAPEIRIIALRATFLLGSDRDAPLLVPLLRHEDPEVRALTCLILALLGAKEASTELAKLLSDNNPDVRGQAVRALVRLGNQGYIEQIALLLSDESISVRKAAGEAIGRMGAKQYSERLLPLLNGQDESLVSVVLVALGRLGAIGHAEGISKLLSSESSEVRAYACQALGRMGARESIGKISHLLSDKEAEARAAAVEAIGLFQSTDHARQLDEVLNDKAASVRVAAIRAIAQLDRKESGQRILAILESQPTSPIVQRAAVDALVQLGREDSVDALERLIPTADSETRLAAILALGKVAGSAPKERRVEISQLFAKLQGDSSDASNLAATISASRLGQREQSRHLALLNEVDGWILKVSKTVDLGENGLRSILDLYKALEVAHLDFLNEALEVDSYGKLSRRVEITQVLESRESLTQLAKSAGLKLVLDGDLAIWGRIASGTRASLAQVLERLVCHGEFRIILDKDTVRISSRQEAVRAWRTRLGNR